MRPMSAGALNNGGRVSARVNTTAPRNPSTPAQTTVHRLAVMTMPAKHSRNRTPHTTKGQARRTNLSAVQSRIKDAGSWPKLSAGRAAVVKAGRPAVGEMARQEGIASEIDAVDAAEQDTDLPRQRIAPVWPPVVPSRRCDRRGLLRSRRERNGEDCDEHQRHAPERQRPAPGSV